MLPIAAAVSQPAEKPAAKAPAKSAAKAAAPVAPADATAAAPTAPATTAPDVPSTASEPELAATEHAPAPTETSAPPATTAEAASPASSARTASSTRTATTAETTESAASGGDPPAPPPPTDAGGKPDAGRAPEATAAATADPVPASVDALPVVADPVATPPPVAPAPPPAAPAPIVQAPPPVAAAPVAPPPQPVVPTPEPVTPPPPPVTPASTSTTRSASPAPWLVGSAAAGAAAAASVTPPSVPPVDPLAVEPEEITEVVRTAAPTGPIDTPWAKTETERTEIQTVRPPEEIVRPAGPAGIICPACATENEATRRFCKSCGTLLVAPVPTPVVRSVPRPRSFRLILLVPILLVAGILGFGLTVVLRGGLGGTGSASTAPSAPSAPSGSAVRPSESAAASSKPSAATTKIAVSDAKASSVLGGNPKYNALKVIDHNLSTSWQEGVKNETGQYVRVILKAPADIQSITIWAGSQAAEANYFGNLRPHHIQVMFDDGPAQPWELKDTFGPQVIALSGHADTYVKFIIVDTYPSQKTALEGSPFDDCAISEIQLNGAP